MTEYTRELAAERGIDIDAEYSMAKHRSLRGRINAYLKGEKSGIDVPLSMTISMLAEIERLREENARIERINSDMSWDINPDRMGMF